MLLGIAAIIGSALCYAVNIVLMRQQALAAKPLEINFFQSRDGHGAVAARASAGRHSAWPAANGSWIVGRLPCSRPAGTLLFAWAYARGPASYLAVTEYSAFLWASLLGWLVFRERVSLYTLAGAVLIVGGCLIAARGKSRRAAGDRRGGLAADAEHVDGEREHADVEGEGGEAVDGHDLAHVRFGDHRRRTSRTPFRR